MARKLPILFDPMFLVLGLALLLALVLPAAGENADVARHVSNVGIFLLFLVNGMRIARAEILRAFVNWRFFAPLLLWVFGAMSLLGLGLFHIGSSVLPPLVALGLLYLGTLPSTIQSSISYTTLANGNVALSVVGAALVNIAGVFVTAPLFALLAGGEASDIGNGVILRIGLILVLPFVIGQLVQGWTRDWIVERKAKIVWLDRIVIGIAVYVAFSGAVEQGLLQMFDLASGLALVGLVCLMLLVAHVAVWQLSRFLGYAYPDRTAFLFAGAQKSVAIGAPLAAILFKPDVAGFVIAPLLLYHLLQLMIAAPIASRLSRHQA